MVQIPDEAKEEITYTDWLPEGIHKVKIVEITQETNANGKEFFEVVVQDEEDRMGTARLYMSEAAIKYSVNTIRGIFVHNTVEKNRDTIRNKVNAVKDTDELLKLSQALIGKECWYSRFPNGSTYTASDGSVRASYNSNIYHYEPKPPAEKSKEAQINELLGGSEPVSNDEVPFN